MSRNPRPKPENTRQLKKRIDYDPDTPRCGNCRFHTRAAKSLPSVVIPTEKCIKHFFTCHANGLCNDWKGINGEELS